MGEIGTAFKGTRYPDKGDKDEAWERFESLVERAKPRSAENGILSGKRIKVRVQGAQLKDRQQVQDHSQGSSAE